MGFTVELTSRMRVPAKVLQQSNNMCAHATVSFSVNSCSLGTEVRLPNWEEHVCTETVVISQFVLSTLSMTPSEETDIEQWNPDTITGWPITFRKSSSQIVFGNCLLWLCKRVTVHVKEGRNWNSLRVNKLMSPFIGWANRAIFSYLGITKVMFVCLCVWAW